MTNRTVKIFRIPDIEITGFYSQLGQDIILNDIFKHLDPVKYFIDIGAHNGRTFSNSLYFEEIGWNGICVEANPNLISELSTNRKCIVKNLIISPIDGFCEFLVVHGNSEMLSTPNFGENQKNVSRIHTNLRKSGGRISTEYVQSKKLTQLLTDNHVKVIDFISIDVEGSEMGVLKSLDLSQFDIKLFVVENNYCSPKIYQFFRQNNYFLLFTQGSDEYYVHENIFPLLSKNVKSFHVKFNPLSYIFILLRKLNAILGDIV